MGYICSFYIEEDSCSYFIAYDVFPVGEYVGDDINKHRDCVEQKNQFYNLHAKLFDRLQIQVVRNVCFVRI